jgi:hypothetical protein
MYPLFLMLIITIIMVSLKEPITDFINDIEARIKAYFNKKRK